MQEIFPIRYENVRSDVGVYVGVFAAFWGLGLSDFNCLSDFFLLANSPPPRPRALILSGSFTWLLNRPRLELVLLLIGEYCAGFTEYEVSLISC